MESCSSPVFPASLQGLTAKETPAHNSCKDKNEGADKEEKTNG